MKGDVLAVGRYLGRAAAAFLRDGRLHDVIVDPPKGAPRLGSLHRGIADQPAPGLGGQFVRLASGRGFLRKGALPPGEAVTVQVTGYAEPGKAPPLTQRIQLRGRHMVLTPGAPGVNVSRKITDPDLRSRLAAIARDLRPEIGVVLRTSAGGEALSVLEAELARLIARAECVFDRGDAVAECDPGPDPLEALGLSWPRAPQESFEAFEVADLIDAALEPERRLGGARAFVEATRALVAIDVNTGADFGKAAGLKANLALAEALPRILRCRGLGGQIVIDPAPLAKAERGRFERALDAAFGSDPVGAQLVGWTPLGHVEITRPRQRYPIG
jgi:Ribonuclease G/E